jgi:hypothetical protein
LFGADEQKKQGFDVMSVKVEKLSVNLRDLLLADLLAIEYSR